MKKPLLLIAAILAAFPASSFAQKISALPSGGAVADGDLYISVQGGADVKIPASALKTYTTGSLVIGANIEGWSAKLDAVAAGTYLIAGTNITLAPAGNSITISSSGGGGITLGSHWTGYGAISSGVFDLANPVNSAGGLVATGADGTINILGTADAGNFTVVLGGDGASAVNSSVAIGGGAKDDGTGNSVVIGWQSQNNGYEGVAVGSRADSAASYSVAVGRQASASGIAGVSVGYLASATTGIAIGSNNTGNGATETGGGAELGPGSYGGTGMAYLGDEIAVSNGSGFATLTGEIDSSAPASSGASGVPGQFAYDANFYYVCVAPNTWKRAALSTW